MDPPILGLSERHSIRAWPFGCDIHAIVNARARDLMHRNYEGHIGVFLSGPAPFARKKWPHK